MALLRDGSRGEEDRRRALRELEPAVRRTARRVAARYGGGSAVEVVEEALGVIWEAREGYTEGRPFEPWCYTVLKNRLLGHIKQEQTEWRRRSVVAGRQAASLKQALETASEQPDPLDDSDLREVRAWPLRQRLALLSLCGLWEKVPAEEWQEWVHEDGLSLPFPPEVLSGVESITRRNEILAGALGVRRNTLSVWLYRYRERVRALTCVRNLLGGL
jgi:DNA-directed RNA polymerase specialized sigma24 family protein